jgi:hypothetical protein
VCVEMNGKHFQNFQIVLSRLSNIHSEALNIKVLMKTSIQWFHVTKSFVLQ